MSASESPDSKSTASEPPAETPATEPESGEVSSSAKASRISQAPTVCGDEGDLEFSEKGKAEDDSSGGDADGEAAEEPPEDPVEVAKAEAKRIREQLVRTAADFDNYRKRARREQEDASRRGKEGVLKDLLPIFDNLERAAGHADKTQDIKSLSDGLRMVLKQFEQALERIGIARVPSVGQPFDPTVHEAIQHLESTEHPAGVVMTEVQSGYQMGTHLIRACMVVVSKGPGPEASPEAAPDGGEEAESSESDSTEEEAAATDAEAADAPSDDSES